MQHTRPTTAIWLPRVGQLVWLWTTEPQEVEVMEVDALRLRVRLQVGVERVWVPVGFVSEERPRESEVGR